MRASLLQIAVNDDESVNSRRERAASLVRAQQHSDLVVLPELWPTGAWSYAGFADEAEPLEGPTYEAMAKAARDAGVWLHAGSFVERDPEGPLYNTSLVFAPDGELAVAYRKIHRFGFDEGEAVLLGAGRELVTVPAAGLRLGLATCYDLRFPELFRGLVDAGANAFVIPAGWPARRREHWSLLARARAVENQAYVLACGTAGTHAGVEQAGYSVVVDPWGEVIGEAGAGEETLVVELDEARPAATREQFPALKDRVLGVAEPERR
ncbi:carbon-nitrogen family hydrolase [Streptomyces sp. NPDC004111]|uniref:carbon-nitrogen family hydrolase n=1 Tax=Streptomyces sp. NPDC004111 TaxID=3364690 RepID=UPI0036CBD790